MAHPVKRPRRRPLQRFLATGSDEHAGVVGAVAAASRVEARAIQHRRERGFSVPALTAYCCRPPRKASVTRPRRAVKSASDGWPCMRASAMARS